MAMRQHWWRWSTTVLLILTAGCDGHGVFVMHEEYVIGDNGERYLGGSCEELSDGIGTSTGTGGEGLVDYGISHRKADDGVEVIVQLRDGTVREMKHYGREFLLSGDVDEFVVDLVDDDKLRLRYWGGVSCERVRAPE